jgi:hypothetical protein
MKKPAFAFTLAAIAAAAGLAALAAPAAQAADPSVAKSPALPEASIPFADHGGVNNWETDGSRGLWVESSRHEWYYGTFATPCSGLNTAETIRFKFSPSGTLDRFSTIATRDTGRECWFKSFTKSEGPPRKAPAGKAKDAKPAPASVDQPSAAKPAAGKP